MGLVIIFWIYMFIVLLLSVEPSKPISSENIYSYITYNGQNRVSECAIDKIKTNSNDAVIICDDKEENLKRPIITYRKASDREIKDYIQKNKINSIFFENNNWAYINNVAFVVIEFGILTVICLMFKEIFNDYKKRLSKKTEEKAGLS